MDRYPKHRASWRTTTAVCLTLAALVVAVVGCNPVKYLSKNMCVLVNCDSLFFIEDLLPLSTRPTGDGGGGGDSGGEDEDEGGGGGGHDH